MLLPWNGGVSSLRSRACRAPPDSSSEASPSSGETESVDQRLKLSGEKVEEEEILLKGYGRVRDIKTGPEGAIYVLLNEPDQVVRLTQR